MAGPKEIHVDRIELSEYPERAPFRLWLEDHSTVVAFLIESGAGKAIAHRPTWADLGAKALHRNPSALVTLGTRPVDEEERVGPRVIEADDPSAEEGAEWGDIVFGYELGMRLEEGQSIGRVLWSGHPVVGLEPGRV